MSKELDALRKNALDNCNILPFSKSTRPTFVDNRIRLDNIANTLSCGDGGFNQSTANIIPVKSGETYRYRKLTEIECERLMSWKDNWTKYGIDKDGKKYLIPSNARYAACGNGIVSTVSKTIIEKLLKNRKEQTRVFSVCSGVDGSSMSLNPKRFKKVAFSEFDPDSKKQHSAAILKYKYPKVPNLGDLTQIQSSGVTVPKFDLMFASTPCQTFSSAGNREGLGNIRGTLFSYVVELLKQHTECNYFIFENVKGLLDHDGGRSFLTILKAFSDIGFEVDFELCTAQNFGVPQARQRIFLFGVRNGGVINDAPSNPLNIEKLPIVVKTKLRILTDYPEISLCDFNIPISSNSKILDISDVLETEVAESYFLSKPHMVQKIFNDGELYADRICLKTEKTKKVPA